jgi:hypothetical protein
MKKILTLILISSTLMIASCANVATKSLDLEPGMSKSQLKSLMGTPGDRQFSGNVEAWQYCDTGMMKDEYLIVWLANNQVVETQRYENAYSIGMCSSYKTINWEDAPDKIVEIRER